MMFYREGLIHFATCLVLGRFVRLSLMGPVRPSPSCWSKPTLRYLISFYQWYMPSTLAHSLVYSTFLPLSLKVGPSSNIHEDTSRSSRGWPVLSEQHRHSICFAQHWTHEISLSRCQLNWLLPPIQYQWNIKSYLSGSISLAHPIFSSRD